MRFDLGASMARWRRRHATQQKAEMMCSAKSSIWRISSSHGIAPWSKNQANHWSSLSPPIRFSASNSALT
jgi:hypothetical protein